MRVYSHPGKHSYCFAFSAVLLQLHINTTASYMQKSPPFREIFKTHLKRRGADQTAYCGISELHKTGVITRNLRLKVGRVSNDYESKI